MWWPWKKNVGRRGGNQNAEAPRGNRRNQNAGANFGNLQNARFHNPYAGANLPFRNPYAGANQGNWNAGANPPFLNRNARAKPVWWWPFNKKTVEPAANFEILRRNASFGRIHLNQNGEVIRGNQTETVDHGTHAYVPTPSENILLQREAERQTVIQQNARNGWIPNVSRWLGWRN